MNMPGDDKREPRLDLDLLPDDVPVLTERVEHAAGREAFLQVYGLERDPFGADLPEAVFFPSATHQQACQQMLHLARYGDGLVVLSAEAGAGKSLLLQAVLARVESDTIIVRLSPGALATPEQVLAEIASGLAVSGAPDYTLRDWVEALCDVCDELSAQSQSLLVALDDGDQLSDEGLNAVMEVVGRRPEVVRVLVTVQFASLDRIRKLAASREVNIHPVMLSRLTPEEVYDYLRFRMQQAGNDGFPFTTAQVEDIIAQTQGRPAAINALARRLLSAGPVGGRGAGALFSRLRFGRWHYAGVGVALVLLLVGVFYSPEQSKQSETASPQPVAQTSIALPAPPEAAPAAPAEQTQPMASTVQAMEPVAVVANEGGEGSTLGGVIQRDVPAPASTPVTAPAEPVQPVEAVASSAPAPTSAQPEPAPVAVATVPAVAEAAPPTPAEPAAPAPKPAAPAKEAPKAESRSTVRSDEKVLLGMPASAYTVQLFGTGSEAAMKRALSQKASGIKVRYFRTELNGKPFYIAVHGQFANAAEARRAIDRLPAALKAEKPWPVQLGKVQARIRAAR